MYGAELASANAAPATATLTLSCTDNAGNIEVDPVSKRWVCKDGQVAKINVVGIGEVAGRVRMLAATVDGATQLGQVRIFIGNDPRLRVGSFARADIVIAQSCNVAITVSAVLYGHDTSVVAVVRNDRVETRQVTVGLMSEGEAEIREGLTEGDLVVAKAGAFFREGDRVRPFLAGAPAEKK